LPSEVKQREEQMNDRACRVLLIEDDPNDVRLVKNAFDMSQATFELTVTSDLAAGVDAVCTRSWDVVLADLSLPDGHGLDAVRQLQLSAPDLPIIVLTGLASDETALDSLNHGAQDYLVKDNVTPEILERAIRYAVQRQNSLAMRRLLDQVQANERVLEKKNRRLARLYKTAHRFVDNVSHEFRTPLTVVNEYVSLLRDGIVGPINDDQKRMLDVIGDRAGDLNYMVDDMLDISRLEAGMLTVWRQPCQFVDIINHVRPSLIRKSIVKEVDLQFDIPDDLPEVYVDDEKISRVIINLTVNAIKFCGHPGTVHVWAKYEEQNRQVIAGVTDNGDGISAENLAVIFQRFKQVSANPRGSTKGFGLGLNIAKELVQLNLGEISVKSTVGAGSTFWFSLPVADPVEVMSRYVTRMAQLHKGRSSLSLLMATTVGPAAGMPTDDVNMFLNMLLRRHDLIFRIDQDQWLLAVPCEQTELSAFALRTEESRQKINRNRPGVPLPRIAMETVGTWLLADGASEILDAVARLSQPHAISRS
jgi:signal transduction histidine kinase